MSECALCSDATPLQAVQIAPLGEIAVCATCGAGLAGQIAPDPHWACLETAIWSEDPVVQVAAYRLVHAMRIEAWASDLLDTVWMDPDLLEHAQAHPIAVAGASGHRDSNGQPLAQGDTVVLVKDLTVKGANFTAKRGTAVRGISLVQDNPEHIEGRVNDQRIVILTRFVKKS
ncbi:alkylphosphonate utilization protein [Roseibaca sp. Y0-43]|uniref:alkylphosphonate utilization protein n=1 Tax=Roseibaca sp. Y0-43 TaxID=2816854 RepID=UPI001D0CAC18|nr:alkylphosphonate utilization protein [Roseibaca sp. Y0-43]MCC1481752.1 alkylphosphonate utilization protein [Roseibaca sp. Y0-43]